MAKIHRDIMIAIVQTKVPLDDLKVSLMRVSNNNKPAVYQALDEITNLKNAIEFKVKQIETILELE